MSFSRKQTGSAALLDRIVRYLQALAAGGERYSAFEDQRKGIDHIRVELPLLELGCRWRGAIAFADPLAQHLHLSIIEAEARPRCDIQIVPALREGMHGMFP